MDFFRMFCVMSIDLNFWFLYAYGIFFAVNNCWLLNTFPPSDYELSVLSFVCYCGKFIADFKNDFIPDY